MSTELTGVIAEYIAAVNALDIDRIMATFAADAFVNDNHREIWGRERIRQFFIREFIGDPSSTTNLPPTDHGQLISPTHNGTEQRLLPEPRSSSSSTLAGRQIWQKPLTFSSGRTFTVTR
jgi:hypothetical protein